MVVAFKWSWFFKGSKYHIWHRVTCTLYIIWYMYSYMCVDGIISSIYCAGCL